MGYVMASGAQKPERRTRGIRQRAGKTCGSRMASESFRKGKFWEIRRRERGMRVLREHRFKLRKQERSQAEDAGGFEETRPDQWRRARGGGDGVQCMEATVVSPRGLAAAWPAAGKQADGRLGEADAVTPRAGRGPWWPGAKDKRPAYDGWEGAGLLAARERAGTRLRVPGEEKERPGPRDVPDTGARTLCVAAGCQSLEIQTAVQDAKPNTAHSVPVIAQELLSKPRQLLGWSAFSSSLVLTPLMRIHGCCFPSLRQSPLAERGLTGECPWAEPLVITSLSLASNKKARN